MSAEEPVICDYKSIKIELEPGVDYTWCACGRSKTQPFCDGSHAACQTLRPVVFQVQEKKIYSLCACKHTQRAPFCDGTHKTLPRKE